MGLESWKLTSGSQRVRRVSQQRDRAPAPATIRDRLGWARVGAVLQHCIWISCLDDLAQICPPLIMASVAEDLEAALQSRGSASTS